MNKKASQKIVDAETIHSVKDLEWIAKVLADGFLHGKHESGRLGSGMEFQQYRPYVIGDDIRNIDWKMFAKTDKYYVKQTSIPTEHKNCIVIDNSLSMNYQEAGRSKLLFAKILTAAITRVLSNQGDQFSWQSGDHSIPMSSGLRHWQNALNDLYSLDASKNDSISPPLARNHTTFLWISDLYYPIEEIEAFFKSIKGPKSELIVFHILGDAEKSLSFSKSSTFVDLETNERIDVNAPKIRKQYQEKLSAHIEHVRNLCFEYGVFHEQMSLNEPIASSLSRFFFHYQLIGLS
jgi:uncharacterized protein (DUF58 family)